MQLLSYKTCTIYILYLSLSKMLEVMNFEDITGDGCLWAVRYAGDPDNILAMTFEKWNDQDWLKDFFVANSCDLSSNI